VFPTSSGSRRDKDNARERVIRPVVAHAEALLAKRGREPLPAGVTAHKLRHTFASILYVRGEDPPYVIGQLGHTDAGASRSASTPMRCAATRAPRSA
jgi:integrase